MQPPAAQVPAERLGLARQDAKMMLDGLSGRDLLERMSELAGSDAYPDVRHLLVVGSWGGAYLESRGLRGELETWETARNRALRPLLSPASVRALDDLEPLRYAAEIPTLLRGHHDRTRAQYGASRG